MNWAKLLVKPVYATYTTADALFFETEHGGHATRIEAPLIQKEFTDDAYLGRDPEGQLWYDDLADLDGSRHPYVVKQVYSTDSSHTPGAHVIFYRQDPEHPYAEFIGTDLHKIVTTLHMDGHSSSGEWKPLQIIGGTATVRRVNGGRTVLFDVSSNAVKATIDLDANPGTVLALQDIDVTGNFSFKNRSELPTAIHANWNQDRIVFYKDDWTGKDFVGYFIPMEKGKGSNTDLGDASKNGFFDGVKWQL